MVSRTYFARMEDRPMFRVTQKISHENEDLQWIQRGNRK